MKTALVVFYLNKSSNGITAFYYESYPFFHNDILRFKMIGAGACNLSLDDAAGIQSEMRKQVEMLRNSGYNAIAENSVIEWDGDINKIEVIERLLPPPPKV